MSQARHKSDFDPEGVNLVKKNFAYFQIIRIVFYFIDYFMVSKTPKISDNPVLKPVYCIVLVIEKNIT